MNVKSNNSPFKIILTYIISILLLTSYAMYKNGYLIYKKGLVTPFYILKPLLLVLSCYIITILIDLLFNKKNLTDLIKEDYNPIYFSLITLALPIDIKLINYYFILIICAFIPNLIKKYKVNLYSAIKLIFILSMVILSYYNYKSVYEINVETSLSILDMFFGRSVGGIGTTNHALIIICFMILCVAKSYKKEIVLSGLLTYIGLIIISLLFNFNFYNNINILLNSTFLYTLVFIATIPNTSPLTFNDKIIYGILVGGLSFIFNYLINPFEGIFIAIIVIDIIKIIINKIRSKK